MQSIMFYLEKKGWGRGGEIIYSKVIWGKNLKFEEFEMSWVIWGSIIPNYRNIILLTLILTIHVLKEYIINVVSKNPTNLGATWTDLFW